MVTDLQELMADLQAMRQSSVAVDADLLARIQQIVADMQAAIAGLPAASKR